MIALGIRGVTCESCGDTNIQSITDVNYVEEEKGKSETKKVMQARGLVRVGRTYAQHGWD